MFEDVTGRMCSSVSVALSGMIVLVESIILSNHRNGVLEDGHVVGAMMLSFALNYLLIQTILEPLQASVQAVHVGFAQHPQSLSQAFPLIFHRLSRIAEQSNQL